MKLSISQMGSSILLCPVQEILWAGGNGDADADDCVTIGPFADYTFHLG